MNKKKERGELVVVVPSGTDTEDKEEQEAVRNLVLTGNVYHECLLVGGVEVDAYLFVHDGKMVVAVPSIGCYKHSDHTIPTVWDFIGSGHMDFTTAHAVYAWVAWCLGA